MKELLDKVMPFNCQKIDPHVIDLASTQLRDEINSYDHIVVANH